MGHPIDISTSQKMPMPSSEQQTIDDFWRKMQEEIEATEDFSKREIPMTRLKKAICAEKGKMMMSFDTPSFLTKACEIFVQELSLRSWMCANSHHRKIILDSDIAEAIASIESYAFLTDVLSKHQGERNSSAHNPKSRKKRNHNRLADQPLTSRHPPPNKYPMPQFIPQSTMNPHFPLPPPLPPTNDYYVPLPFQFLPQEACPLIATTITQTPALVGTIHPMNYTGMGGLGLFGNENSDSVATMGMMTAVLPNIPNEGYISTTPLMDTYYVDSAGKNNVVSQDGTTHPMSYTGMGGLGLFGNKDSDSVATFGMMTAALPNIPNEGYISTTPLMDTNYVDSAGKNNVVSQDGTTHPMNYTGMGLGLFGNRNSDSVATLGMMTAALPNIPNEGYMSTTPLMDTYYVDSAGKNNVDPMNYTGMGLGLFGNENSGSVATLGMMTTTLPNIPNESYISTTPLMDAYYADSAWKTNAISQDGTIHPMNYGGMGLGLFGNETSDGVATLGMMTAAALPNIPNEGYISTTPLMGAYYVDSAGKNNVISQDGSVTFHYPSVPPVVLESSSLPLVANSSGPVSTGITGWNHTEELVAHIGNTTDPSHIANANGCIVDPKATISVNDGEQQEQPEMCGRLDTEVVSTTNLNGNNRYLNWAETDVANDSLMKFWEDIMIDLDRAPLPGITSSVGTVPVSFDMPDLEGFDPESFLVDDIISGKESTSMTHN